MSDVVKRPVSLGEQVAAVLRRRIVRGELGPGDRLTEESLAEEFEVSRGPVRDAITQLVFERLLRIQKPRGVYVVGLNAEDIEQLYSLRGALERLAISRAMRSAVDERWLPLTASVSLMNDAADTRDHAGFLRADLAFHSEIYVLSNHPRLEAAWRQYSPTFEALLEATINHDDDLHESAADHQRLLTLMQAGDEDVAVDALERHLEGALKRMLLELEHPSDRER
ncbi:GntR family transcriptional regulator [Microbacterium sp.]|uniref:GntR family transcriptional regulator n=1 Tax=Microbacterium sp. TaxID=51671 RepID=UPI003F6FE8FE